MSASEGPITVRNFINGEFIDCDKYIDSFDPSTGQVWAKIPDSGKTEVDHAVNCAKQAFPKWSKTPAVARSKLLSKIADLLEDRLEEFARMESKDQGKPVSLARAVDIPRAVYNFRFFSSAILHRTHPSSQQEHFNAINYVCQMPVGVAGLITPWNLPLYLLTFKVAPALAAGNTVVAKPSEMTSVTSWMLAEILNQAGLPPGVVNFVYGTGPSAGSALVEHPDVNLISFTGSPATAERIRVASSPYSRKLSLELGGKNPAVVFDDVNLEKYLPTIVRSCYANQGEICLCTSRVFVQEKIYQDFLAKFVEAVRQIKVGKPSDTDTVMGALVSKEHLAKVRGFVTLARSEGAKILCGDGIDSVKLPPENEQGYFILPTVVTGVTDNSALMQEEIFGPVVCIVPFQTEEEVVKRANNVKYGLAASVWSQDVGRIHRVAQELHAGTVWCNCWMVRDLNMPFGGMKASGIGREGMIESMEFFTETKTICIKMN